MADDITQSESSQDPPGEGTNAASEAEKLKDPKRQEDIKELVESIEEYVVVHPATENGGRDSLLASLSNAKRWSAGRAISQAILLTASLIVMAISLLPRLKDISQAKKTEDSPLVKLLNHSVDDWRTNRPCCPVGTTRDIHETACCPTDGNLIVSKDLRDKQEQIDLKYAEIELSKAQKLLDAQSPPKEADKSTDWLKLISLSVVLPALIVLVLVTQQLRRAEAACLSILGGFVLATAPRSRLGRSIFSPRILRAVIRSGALNALLDARPADYYSKHLADRTRFVAIANALYDASGGNTSLLYKNLEDKDILKEDWLLDVTSQPFLKQFAQDRDCYETLCSDPAHRWRKIRVAARLAIVAIWENTCSSLGSFPLSKRSV